MARVEVSKQLMLDSREFRRNPQKFKDALKLRGLDLDLKTYSELEQSRHDLQTEMESLQHDRNEVSRAIGQAKSQGEDIEDLVAGVSNIGERLAIVRQEFTKVQDELQDFMLTIPNVPHESVPPGNDEDDNQLVRIVGNTPKFNFEPLDHVDLTKGLIDFERAALIAGSRFSVLRGPIARLHRALIQFMLEIHVSEHGYEELYVPHIVNRETMTATGQLPKFEEDLFKVQRETDHYLIPTAEVPITSMVRDQILIADELPLRFVAHTPCYRSESGSYGRDTRGMIRLHQFEKVELVQICHPDSSWDAHEEITSHAENILKRLELPYRVVNLCGGDLGFSAAKTLDLEVWIPSQERYREISSSSNFVDFQARRGQIRFRERTGGPVKIAHTLNASGLAVGRTLVALLENFQDGEGRVHIPISLQPYLGGTTVLKFEENV